MPDSVFVWTVDTVVGLALLGIVLVSFLYLGVCHLAESLMTRVKKWRGSEKITTIGSSVQTTDSIQISCTVDPATIDSYNKIVDDLRSLIEHVEVADDDDAFEILWDGVNNLVYWAESFNEK